MKTIPEKSEKLLKSVHLLAMSVWFTALLIMFTINLMIPNATTAESFYFGHYINYIIDFIIVTPAAILTFLTGLFYMLFTKWKVKENPWIRIKAIITVLIILVGTFWLGPLLKELTETAKLAGLDLLHDNRYTININIITCFSLTNAIVLLVAIVISVFKPGYSAIGK